MNTTTKRILLFTGGTLGDWALQERKHTDVVVGVDRGALFLVQHGITPALAIGDFDSVDDAELASIKDLAQEWQTCDPVDKDWTDTEMAFYWALEQEPTEIVMLGALGSRYDHSFANMQLLIKAETAGIPCRIIDERNELRVINKQATINKDSFTYVSLLPLSPTVTGITLTGFQYPLTDATLAWGQSLGVSNRLDAEQGTITLTDGYLLVIKSKD